MTELRKDSPTVAAVHVGTAIGNAGLSAGKKRKPLDEYVAEADGSKVEKRRPMRALLRHDHATAKSPFPYDPGVLGTIRPDQVPRFFGALTDPDRLDLKDVKLNSLTAMQNRVDPAKVQAFAEGRVARPKPAVVVRLNGKHYIADGHHRLTADWLNGADTARVRFKDLTPYSNLMKADETWLAQVTKVASVMPELQVAYGWASVIEKDGQVVTDSQGDRISEAEMVKAAHDYIMRNGRIGGVMHWQGDSGEPLRGGEIVESMLFTKDLQRALGIDLHKVGWLIGYKVSDELWPLVKAGHLPMFSIGGKGLRVPA